MVEQFTTSQCILRSPIFSFSRLTFGDKYSNYFVKSVDDSIFLEALFIAAINFYHEFLKAHNKAILDQKLSQSLLKYHIRTCTRCTPYGLFAGLHVAEISEKTTEIRISSVPKPKLRLDTDYLVNVYNDLCKDQDLLIHLRYYPNSSLFKIGQKWRYHELRFMNQHAVFHLVTIDDNVVINELIKKSSNGISYKQALEIITSFGVEVSEAHSFLLSLTQSQVFINELYPNVSGLEYQTRLFTKLAQFIKYQQLPSQIDEVLESKGTIIQKTESIKGVLTTYFNTAINESKFIQVDTCKTAYQSNINDAIGKQVLEAANLLHRLSAFDDSQLLLQKFKQAFYERYEEAEVPLLALLDTDIGIHYKNAANELDLRNTNKNNMLWDVHAKFRMQLFVKFQKENLNEILLTDEDLKLFTLPKDTLPDTMSFMGELLQEGQEIKIIWGGMTNNATVLLGRFGHLDPSVEKLCKEITKQEEALQPDKIFAEIVHISEGRLGNILTRPHYRTYEIPYLALSTLPFLQQIQINDLWVSIRNGRLVLRSKRLNKEVLPRMANAHNYSAKGLPIYHFLCDLQHQGVKGYLGWNWSFLGGEKFLPRVIYKNVILSPAYWNVPAEELKAIQKAKPEQLNPMFANLIKEYNLPEKVFLSEGDNELLLDLTNQLCRDILLDVAKKYTTVKLTECLFNENNLLVKDENGNGYTNEIIIPFVKQADKIEVIKNDGNRKKTTKAKAQRIFEPYSEWVYFKLYTGTKTADKILIQQIDRITNNLQKEGAVNKWFFIRYADPKNHLRIRFNLSSTTSFNNLNNLLQKQLSPLVKNGLIWKIQTDTYQRELERYGHETMELSEDFFHINSKAILDLLKLFSSDAAQENRFIIGLMGVVKLYDAYGYSIQERLSLIEEGATSYGREFGLQNSQLLRDKIKDDYRKLLPQMEFLLKAKSTNTELYLSICKSAERIYKKQHKALIPIAKMFKFNSYEKSIDELMPSYIHMFINRFYNSNQRFEEFIIYQLLEKYYKSQLARAKYNS